MYPLFHYISFIAFSCQDAQIETNPVSKSTNNPVFVQNTSQRQNNNSNTNDPLSNKTLFEICKSDSLSLIRWSFKERSSKKDCCSNKMTERQKKDLLCSYDWPESGTPCSEYERVKNEIYAQYGKPFTDKKWQQYLESKSWYVPKDDFSEDWLSKTAKENVALLSKMKEQNHNCSN